MFKDTGKIKILTYRICNLFVHASNQGLYDVKSEIVTLVLIARQVHWPKFFGMLGTSWHYFWFLPELN